MLRTEIEQVEQVHRAKFGMLVSWTKARITNSYRAEEIVQQAFLIALERPPAVVTNWGGMIWNKVRGLVSVEQRRDRRWQTFPLGSPKGEDDSGQRGRPTSQHLDDQGQYRGGYHGIPKKGGE